MAGPPDVLSEAKALFEAGRFKEAEAILSGLATGAARDPSVLNFRAYLLYRQGLLGEAAAAYRELSETDPEDTTHLSNLGLIYLKDRKIHEARRTFSKVVELQPQNRKARRNLGHCLEKLGLKEEARQCFISAGEDDLAVRVLRSPARGERTEVDAAGPGMPAGSGLQGEDVARWFERCSGKRGESGDEVLGSDRRGLLLNISEKTFLRKKFVTMHRGVIVFSPHTKQAQRASAKFGEGRGGMVRVEGNGEVRLSGGGRRLHILHSAADIFYVNYTALVLTGGEIELDFEESHAAEGRFLATRVSGVGPCVVATLGETEALRIPPDLPTYVRPDTVVAWSGDLSWEIEKPGLAETLLRRESGELMVRFEGRGCLLLQDMTGQGRGGTSD